MKMTVSENDVNDSLKVYGDKKALPYFNSDNCHGDNFYYPTGKKMLEAIRFWLREYSERKYVRFTIFDKAENVAVGTIEIFNRKSEDYFNDCGLLRLDLHPDYENNRGGIADVLRLITEPIYNLFHCEMIATKVPAYAVERIAALKKLGFASSNECLIGEDGKAYDGYWVKASVPAYRTE